MTNLTPPSISIFTPAAHPDILALVTQITLLLFTARVFGEIARKTNQSSVIGELLAGVLWGPTLLGHLFPFLVGIIIPANPVQGYLLEAISLIGAIFLLLITGMEVDLQLIGRYARSAASVSLGGIVLTTTSGFILGLLIPDAFLVDTSQRWLFAGFIATALCISSIPVVAKILFDFKLLRRDIGQTIVAAGMSDDTIGWVLLSVVAGLVAGGGFSAPLILATAGKVLFFLFISATAGRWLVTQSIKFIQDKAWSPSSFLTLVVVLAFGWGSLSQSLHLEPLLGAFVMGILIGQAPRLPPEVHDHLRSITFGIFAPIFFATAGLKMNLLPLFNGDALAVAAIILAVATGSKVVGNYLGARLAGEKDFWASFAYGAALNARGAMGIIVATTGLSLGVLTPEMFTIVVLMALITSLMTPVLLPWIFTHLHPSEEEASRLRKEEMSGKSLLKNIHRVLVPIRRWESPRHTLSIREIKAGILNRIHLSQPLDLTLLSVERPGQKAANIPFLSQIGGMFQSRELNTKAIESADVINSILDEAQKGYHLLVLGASEHLMDSQHLFSKVIDSLVCLSPCPSLVVHGPETSSDWRPQRILVPTNGSTVTRRAAELAFLLASNGKAEVKLLHVIEQYRDIWNSALEDEGVKRQVQIAEEMIRQLKELGELEKASVTSEIQFGPDPESVILNIARQEDIHLIILGTEVRSASDRLFLGPGVETIIRQARCPVLIFNTP